MTTYRIIEIARAAGVTVRTLRHWTALGLLPAPRLRGNQTSYDEAFLLRVRAVRALRARGVRLRDVKRRLTVASPVELSVLAAAPAGDSGAVAFPPPPPIVPITYPAQHVEKIILLPGLELHVDGSSALLRRLAQEIYTHYGSAVAHTNGSTTGAGPESPSR